MASYSEVVKGKLDWAMPFQRTDKFPLDRSAMFSSYADALKYAKQDGTDSRQLGGTSYIGQIISVYGNDQAGTAQEVAAYIITGVGASASLMKLAQTTATGDFSKDIQALQTALSALEVRVKAIEDKPDVVDTNTEYEFSTAPTTDGAIQVYNKADKTTQEVQVKGWAELKALASGRNKAYVYTNKEDAEFVTAYGKKGSFKVGDVIYFTDKGEADLWVGQVLSEMSEGSYYNFYELEATKCDLTGFLKETDADAKYATKTEVNAKASQTEVNELKTTVTNNKQALDAKDTELETAINKVSEDLAGIDVSSQITSKINDLDVPIVGGAANSYISSIKQEDGKIAAVASTLPDFASDAQSKADKALQDAKDYTDAQIGEIGETTVKGYVDTAISNSESSTNEAITGVAGRVTVLETNDKDKETRLKAAETTIADHTTQLGGISTRVATVESKVGTLETKVSSIQSTLDTIEPGAQVNKIEVIKVGGVIQNIDATDKSVDIKEISTDLLKNGSKTLVLDCLNAALTEVE